MPSIQSTKVKGRTYWRIVESRRIDGKPRPIPLLYLGSIENIVATYQLAKQIKNGELSAEEAIPPPLEPQPKEWPIEENLVKGEAVVEPVKSAPREPKVTPTPIPAAIIPTKELAIAIPLKAKVLRYGDVMVLHKTSEKIALKTILNQVLGTSGEAFYAGILFSLLHRVHGESWNELKDRTCLKEVVPGIQDLKSQWRRVIESFTFNQCKEILTAVSEKITQYIDFKDQCLVRHIIPFLTNDIQEYAIDIIYSKEGIVPLWFHTDGLKEPHPTNWKVISIETTPEKMKDKNYIALATASVSKELNAIRLQEYQTLPSGIKAYRSPSSEGSESLVFLSPTLHHTQLHTLEQQLRHALKELQQWQASLKDPGNLSVSRRDAEEKIAEILKNKYVKKIILVQYDPSMEGSARLQWTMNVEARVQIETEQLGKRFLSTNCKDWTTEELIAAWTSHEIMDSFFQENRKDTESLQSESVSKPEVVAAIGLFTFLTAVVNMLFVREAKIADVQENGPKLLEKLGYLFKLQFEDGSGKIKEIIAESPGLDSKLSKILGNIS